MEILFFTSNLPFLLFCCLFLCVIQSSLSSENNKNNVEQSWTLSPVILIPGLGGNKIHAKLNKSTVPHSWCSKKSDYFDLWLNLYEMIPEELDCWIDNIKLNYDNVTRKTHNTAGVDIELPIWGSTESIEWIDTRPIVDHFDSGAYFNDIVQALTNRGYIRGKNLLGAPYDFRKGPNENEDWFERLVHLTEYAYKMNNNTRVTYLVHSMGGRMLLYFLQKMPQKWKDEYVKQAISMSTPWAGSVQALVALSIGDNLNSKILRRTKMKKVQETFPSIVWLMPSKFFWKSNEVLANINGTNYTLENIDEFFYTIGIPNIVEMRNDLHDYNDFTVSGVELHCLFGNNLDTVERLNFGTEYNSKPILIKGNGDGVVNERSLIGCEYWEKSPAQQNHKHKIYQKVFPGIDHLRILHSAGPINYIVAILTGHQDYPRADEHLNHTDI